MQNWTTCAFVFPGQGSQKVGMGADFYAQSSAAKAIFDQADDLLQADLSGLMFNGPEDMLNDTYHTQAALYVCSIAMLTALQAQVPAAIPGYLAGHSLGEFTALTVSRVLSFADGLKLVRERGRLMCEAGEKQGGAMAALLGLTVVEARDICQQAQQQSGEPVVVANDNCPGQIVISGGTIGVEAAIALAADAGKRAVKLAVSVAAHSPLMSPASEAFRELLAETPMQAPQIPVYGNVSAAPLPDVAAIRAELDRQLTETVRWTESMQAIIADGATVFLEIGAGDVLNGLLKRIDRAVNRKTLGTIADLSALN